MDARPQRPLRAFHIQSDENIAAQSKQTLHQRHKSTSTLSTMLGAGGLKAAAKRTAFGDVSNTTKLITATQDDIVVGKNNGYENLTKPPQPLEKPAAFLRPAQRPLTVSSLKTLLTGNAQNNNSVPPTILAKAPQSDVQQAQPHIVRVRALSKRSTTVYKDAATSEPENIPQVAPQSAVNQSSAPVLPVHQILGPREHKSQTQLKVDDANPPQTLIELIGHYAEEPNKEVIVAESIPTTSNRVEDDIPHTEDASTRAYEYVDHQSRELPPLPLASEPEEYWEEEDEEETYDEQGYTTAHSYRSRGDNTTGGATTLLFPKVSNKIMKELAVAKEIIESSRTAEEIEDEAWDTSMVAEYGDEIFAYMKELEIKLLPNANYMDIQAEIQWSMRSVLMDWLIQVHHRFSLLPETLFLCVNYIDRFLSCKVVSLGKLQLVGATAIFVAAKYEEINCPSVAEIVYMVDGGYSADEILKAERFMLSMLQFELGWPGPMSFLRRISKADDYDLETRTLAKYFLEVTIMDERFVGSPPSFVAAGAHCLARTMLKKGDWSQAHVYYSGYTWTQLKPLVTMIMECCENPQKHHSAVYEKYADRRYKRASSFVKGEMEKGFKLPSAQATRLSLSSLDDIASLVQYETRESLKRMVQIKG